MTAGIASALFGSTSSVGANTVNTGTLLPPPGLSIAEICTSGASAGLRSVATGGAQNAGALTIPRPAGTAVGDVLVAAVSVVQPSGSTLTAPPGWTQIRIDGSGMMQGLWYRVANGSEGATFTWTFTTGKEAAGAIAAYQGIDTAAPIEAHSGQTASGNAITAPSVTTSAADTLLVGAFSTAYRTTIAPPPAMTESWEQNSGPAGGASNAVTLEGAHQRLTTAGATGTRTATATDADTGVGQLLALKAAAGATTTVTADLKWGQSPSSFAAGYRLQRWRSGVLEREWVVTPSTTDTAIDGPLQEGVTYEYRLVAVYENWTSTELARYLTPSCSADATLLWSRSGTTEPLTTRLATWYPSTQPTAPIGRWQHLEAAASRTRDEIIAVGVRTDGAITAEMRTAGTWSALAANPLATGRPGRQVADVAYETVSGDAMLVWTNGTTATEGLSYRTWNGTTWSTTSTITTPRSGEPQRIRLAANPTSDEMILVVGNATNHDYALVWNGSQWVTANSMVLDDGGGSAGNDAAVAYESLSGDALVTYRQGNGKPAEDVRYRVWNGTWSAQQSASHPIAAGSPHPMWIELAQDPRTDRIAMGVVTDNDYVWTAVWTGSGWVNATQLTAAASTKNGPSVALAFEPLSGKALVTYGIAGGTSIGFRSWTPAGGWGPQGTVLAFGGTPLALTADGRPGTDSVIVGVQDSIRSLTYLQRTGTGTWTVVTNPRMEPDTGETERKPFALLWK